MGYRRNMQLGVSAGVVIAAGVIYGFDPDGILTRTLGFEQGGPELRNVFKAVMGLYWAMGIFWIIGMAKPFYWNAATLSNVLFMGGLALGRGLSLILDGFSAPWAIAMGLELAMMVWGIANLGIFNTRN